MKVRHILLVTLALLTLSCQRFEDVLPDNVEEQHEINLSCEGTRIGLDGLTPCWNRGDEIWLSDGKNVYKAVVPDEYDGLPYTKLVYSGLSQDSAVYALFPYDSRAYVNDGEIISQHPVVQNGTFNSCQIMCGKAGKGEGTIQMKNTSAMLEFYHNREDLSAMQLSNISGEHLSGRSCNVVVTFKGTGTKYFSTLPALLPSGSRFTFVTGDRRLGYIATTNDNRLEINNLYRLGNIDDRIVMDSSPAENLSATESANCYVISTPGSYCINAVKGNGRESVGNVAFVDVLWETNNTSKAPEVHSLVTDCIYSDGLIFFRIPSGSADGNALLAAFDEYGNVLWSWHLWIVSGGVGNQTFSDESMTFSDATLQDRNLGALTADAGKATSGGLLYQYGRKDPFFGSAGLTTREKYGFASHYSDELPETVNSDSSTGTMEYATENPQTFIFKGTNSHWNYKKDISTWSASNKTIYDPCPPGYHIPECSALDGLDLDNTSWSSTKAGRSIKIDGQTIWLPSSGYLYSTSAAFQYVGKIGYYWYDINSSPVKNNCWQVADTIVGNANKTMVYASAFSVRCQKKLSSSDRQTLSVTLVTTVADEPVASPVFYGMELTGKLNWGDGSLLQLSLADTAVSYIHRYNTIGSYTPTALCYGVDSVRFNSIGNYKTIDLSGL